MIECKHQLTEAVLERRLTDEERALFVEAVKKDMERVKRREPRIITEPWHGAGPDTFPPKPMPTSEDAE